MYLHTEAIVIGKRNIREADRIVIFYSRLYGKINALVRGIRKIENRFGSSLDLFTYNEIVLWEKKRGELLTLTQCQAKQPFIKIRSDFKKIVSSLYLINIIDELTKEGDRNVELFNLLLVSLYAVDNSDRLETIVCSFQMKLLSLMGLAPELNKCVVCKNKITGGNPFFSFSRGGLICKACVRFSASNITLPDDTLQTMKKLTEITVNNISKLVLSIKMSREIQHFFSQFVYYHMEKRVKSRKIVEELLYEPRPS